MVKKKGKVLKDIQRQSGELKSIARDMERLGMYPGKRRSRTGEIYWETRKNRSDKDYKKRL